jgi:hypothetical protein
MPREVWRRLVAGMKPGWCNGTTEDLIKLYCTHPMIAGQLRDELRHLATDDNCECAG